MNVLVVAPHPDDESIGCGGALCVHADDGAAVSAVFMTSGEAGLASMPAYEARRLREAEAVSAAEILGIARLEFLRLPDWSLGEHTDAAVENLTALLDAAQPDIIYVPNPKDAHPDHRAAAVAVHDAVSRWHGAPQLLAYEVWTPLGAYDTVVDVSAHMDRKLAAIRCHRSQLTKVDFVRATRALNDYRGAIDARYEFAEVFARVPLDTPLPAAVFRTGWG